ncbi:MAG: ABC transporter permease [Anaerolineaceae bacterium]|nr:ABC transporter permease [Anaerolineaceae bacterium]
MKTGIITTGKRKSSDTFQRLMAFGALIIIFMGFSFASPYFFTFNNVVGILISTAVNGLLALGVTFVIISGGIDLSVGTVMTLSSIMCGVFVTYWNLPIPLGILAGILTGGLAGFVNGLMISKMKLPPFIATLGMLNVARGLSLVISDLQPIYFALDKNFNDIAMGSVLGSVIPGFDIPNGVLIMFASAIVAGLILTKTIIGRYCFAIGSNEEAVRLSGVNIVIWKTAVYTVGGLFVGIAGIIIAARLNSAQPALGLGYELDAIAAAVIGGTSMSGGEGTILGTIIGAFIISTLTNGLRIMSVPQEWQIVVTGFIIISAVYLDILRRGKQR